MNYTVSYLAYFTPIILTALVEILIIALRWFTHKERMGLIAQGVNPEDKQRTRKDYKIILAAGLVLALGGLALTIGLITLGIGPFLLWGLLPLFLGLALILVSFVLAPPKPKKQKADEVEQKTDVATEEVIEEEVAETFEAEEEEEQEVI